MNLHSRSVAELVMINLLTMECREDHVNVCDKSLGYKKKQITLSYVGKRGFGDHHTCCKTG